jgi:hypothetical protein
MNYIKSLFGLFFILLLAGCNDSESNNYTEKSVTRADFMNAKMYFDFTLEESLKKAKTLADPYDAYTLLMKAYHGVDEKGEKLIYKNKDNITITHSKFSVSAKDYDDLGYPDYSLPLMHREEALNSMFGYLDSSLQSGNKKAFLEVYEAQKAYFYKDEKSLSHIEKLQVKYAADFKNLAESLTVKDTIDQDLTLLYAYQNKKGLIYTKNSEKAVEYYQKLYPANPTVALYIVGVYLDINDFENAYFWKVRCINSCFDMFVSLYSKESRGPTITDAFKQHLNEAQFKEIEAAASDPSRKSFK